MGQRDEQSSLGELSAREVLDPRLRIEFELGAQLFRVLAIPRRIEWLHIPKQFAHAHPRGQIAVLRDETDPAQDFHRIRDWIMAEDTNRTRLWFEQPKNMLEERGLARAILANETENQAGGYLEGDSIQREFRTELPAEIPDLDR